MKTMKKMYVIIKRIENENLMKFMIKQIIYHKAMQAINSKEQISISSFSQLINFNKLISNQNEIMLMNE